MSISVYKKTITSTPNPAEIERRILASAACELEQHAEAFDQAESANDRMQVLSGGLRDALWENQRIWMTFAKLLKSPSSELPEALRADLISLSIFVTNTTSAVLGGKGSVAPLVALNRSMIEGLTGQKQQATGS